MDKADAIAEIESMTLHIREIARESGEPIASLAEYMLMLRAVVMANYVTGHGPQVVVRQEGYEGM